MEGRVCKLNMDKGYGFIRQDQKSEKDMFFHFTALRGLDFCEALIGQRVSYERQQTARGWQASEIIAIDPEPTPTPIPEGAQQQ